MKKVGDNIKSSVGAFNFSGNVHKNFENHVTKSVPFYKEGHESQFGVVFLDELIFMSCPQLHYGAHIYLIEGSKKRSRLLCLHQAFCNLAP